MIEYLKPVGPLQHLEMLFSCDVHPDRRNHKFQSGVLFKESGVGINCGQGFMVVVTYRNSDPSWMGSQTTLNSSRRGMGSPCFRHNCIAVYYAMPAEGDQSQHFVVMQESHPFMACDAGLAAKYVIMLRDIQPAGTCWGHSRSRFTKLGTSHLKTDFPTAMHFDYKKMSSQLCLNFTRREPYNINWKAIILTTVPVLKGCRGVIHVTVVIVPCRQEGSIQLYVVCSKNTDMTVSVMRISINAVIQSSSITGWLHTLMDMNFSSTARRRTIGSPIDTGTQTTAVQVFRQAPRENGLSAVSTMVSGTIEHTLRLRLCVVDLDDDSFISQNQIMGSSSCEYVMSCVHFVREGEAIVLEQLAATVALFLKIEQNVNGLEFIMTQKNLLPPQIQWVDVRNQFKLKAAYIPGETNKLPDTLSWIYADKLPGPIRAESDLIEADSEEQRKGNSCASAGRPVALEKPLYAGTMTLVRADTIRRSDKIVKRLGRTYSTEGITEHNHTERPGPASLAGATSECAPPVSVELIEASEEGKGDERERRSSGGGLGMAPGMADESEGLIFPTQAEFQGIELTLENWTRLHELLFPEELPAPRKTFRATTVEVRPQISVASRYFPEWFGVRMVDTPINQELDSPAHEFRWTVSSDEDED